ncbi:MAG: NAD(P)-dependent oxidoreductase [Clostridiales bacterium]|nr:NAD(P)-dependent oxidoreductase [Clostridiales bacterium]
MDYSQLNGKNVFITGATGLIGQALVRKLVLQNANVIALVRDEARAKEIFSDLPQTKIRYFVCDMCHLQAENIGADYVIHCASFTSSKDFAERPADVISKNIRGTERALDFAVNNNVKSFVYLSTMEVYGCPTTDDKISEDSPTNLNAMSVRSCYPESKRLCECLCAAYSKQYDLPAKVIRLTQTFGEGVRYDDGRVFAEFARCAIENRNIILKTKGETKRNYLYIDDAVSAILAVLLYGESGEAYNAANEDTYCSIYEMARLVAEKCSNGIKVEIKEEDVTKFGYAPTLHMNLSCKKLNALGWTAKVGLKEMFDNTIAYMRKSKGL